MNPYNSNLYNSPFENYCRNSVEFLDLPLLVASGMYLGIVGICGFILVKKLFTNKTLKYSNKKEVIILRGVPGVGKNIFIYDQEQDRYSTFSIISFYTGGQHILFPFGISL